MKPSAPSDLTEFVKSHGLLSSYFRVIHHRAKEGKKANSTIQKEVLSKTRYALEIYKRAYGADISSGCTERESAKRLARAFDIRVDW